MLDVDRRHRLTTPNTDRSTPPTWIRRTWGVLWDSLSPLVLINLGGTLLAAPLIALGLAIGFFGFLIALGVTIPVILGAQMAAISMDWRHKPGAMPRHAISAVKRHWMPLITLGLLGAIGGGASLMTTSQLMAGGRGPLVGFWFAQSAVLVVLALLLIYAVPLTATRSLGPRLALRNAMVLVLAAPLPTIGVLALVVALLVLMLWFGLGLWLIVPVILAVVITTNCEAQIERLDAQGRSQ
ncbi:MAG: hypothetical protein ACK5HY_01390 [Parahaliea sp.]